MKKQKESQHQSRQYTSESMSKENFLSFAEMMEEPPNQELAEYYLYGEYGSVEAAEERVPKWFWELPSRTEFNLPPLGEE